MLVAMGIMAAFCIGLGIYPKPLYDMLPYPVDYVPYTGAHVVYQLQLLLFSGLAFFLLLGLLKRTMTITLDVDWFWRRPGKAIARFLDRFGVYTWEWLADAIVKGATKAHDALYRNYGPQGIFGRTWPTGTMAFWTTVTLGAVVILSYL